MQKKYSLHSIRLFGEAWISLAVARIMLVGRPFNKILPVLQNDTPAGNVADIELLRLIQLSIARASVKSPWRTKCFEQALAARMMLKRRGIATTTYFGVLKNERGQMEAHAWLKSGEFVVTGWKRMDEYTVVSVW